MTREASATRIAPARARAATRLAGPGGAGSERADQGRVGNGARLIGAGIVIGVAASFALQRLVSTLLFGVTAADAASGLAVVILAVVAMVACYLPALRATRVSPLNALRYE